MSNHAGSMRRRVPSRCPIPGCRNTILQRSIVCLAHALTVWDDLIQAGMKSDPTLQAKALETAESRRLRLLAEQQRQAEQRKTQGEIYYLRLDDKIKIGWTSDLRQRLSSYPPYAVVLCDHPGTRADERDLHRTFSPSRVAGREWYHPTPELLAHIDSAYHAEMTRRTAEYWATIAETTDEGTLALVKAASARHR